MKTQIPSYLLIMILPLFTLHCDKRQAASEEKPSTPARAPAVTDSRSDLIFSWIADGGPEVASSVAEVPESARKEVRVQDPSIPPDERNPNVIFLADLTQKGSGDKYNVRSISRGDFEKAIIAARPQPPTQQPFHTALPLGDQKVIMYATTHCPVCHKARRWLLEKNIPFIEKDIERDPVAASAVAAKGREQGVSTSGVPIFEINGTLIPGFDPTTIIKMLSENFPPT